MWDEAGDHDWTEEEDWPDENGESFTISCPECGFELHEEVEMCSNCGYFLEDGSSHPLSGRPAWFVVLGILGVLATLAALLQLF